MQSIYYFEFSWSYWLHKQIYSSIKKQLKSILDVSDITESIYEIIKLSWLDTL